MHLAVVNLAAVVPLYSGLTLAALTLTLTLTLNPNPGTHCAVQPYWYDLMQLPMPVTYAANPSPNLCL
jgi:hypothetical protein